MWHWKPPPPQNQSTPQPFHHCQTSQAASNSHQTFRTVEPALDRSIPTWVHPWWAIALGCPNSNRSGPRSTAWRPRLLLGGRYLAASSPRLQTACLRLLVTPLRYQPPKVAAQAHCWQPPSCARHQARRWAVQSRLAWKKRPSMPLQHGRHLAWPLIYGPPRFHPPPASPLGA